MDHMLHTPYTNGGWVTYNVFYVLYTPYANWRWLAHNVFNAAYLDWGWLMNNVSYVLNMLYGTVVTVCFHMPSRREIAEGQPRERPSEFITNPI
jgi:hypothetical protein